MHPNEALIRRGFEAFAAGDMKTLDEFLSDDVVWVSESGGIIGGRHEGKAEVFRNWALIPAETGGTFRQDVLDVYADNRVVVAATEVSATRRGATLDRSRGVIVFVVKDGKLTEGRVISQNPETVTQFWAE